MSVFSQTHFWSQSGALTPWRRLIIGQIAELDRGLQPMILAAAQRRVNSQPSTMVLSTT
jgi:hypothetical protein